MLSLIVYAAFSGYAALFYRENTTKTFSHQASPITHVTGSVPPTFLWHTATDEMVYAANSLLFAQKLIENGVDCELHIFEKGPHGMSLANSQSGGEAILMDPDISIWKELAVQFLKRHFNA